MPQISTLPSGLRVITDEMPNLHSVTMGIWIKAGARYEQLSNHGIAHLLEHMAFKGTKTRSAKDIAEQVENVGGFMNAYTGFDQTAYHMRVLSQDVDLAADILGDILQNSTFDPTELAREKDVVIQEIGECEDNPDDVLFDNVSDLCYPDHPLGRPILGTRDSIKNMSRDKIFDFVKSNYFGHNMIFAASGGITHDQMLSLAEKYMHFPQEGDKFIADAPEWGGGIRFIHKDLEQVHLALTTQGLSYYDPFYFTSEVFSMIYGGSMSSRLFQEVREKHGLVYSISSYTNSYCDAGIFGFTAGTSIERYLDVLEISLNELNKLAHSVTQQETDRAKAQLRSSVIMGLENPSGRIETAVKQQFIFDKFITPQELIDRIDSVTPQDITTYAARLLASNNPTFCALGAIEGTEEAQKIIHKFFNK